MSLAKQHPVADLEKACDRAASVRVATGCARSADLLKRQARSRSHSRFMEEHPLIRSLEEYAAWVRAAFHKEAQP